MQFLRIGPRGSEVPVVRIGRQHYNIRPVTDDLGPEFWPDGPDRVLEAFDEGVLPLIDIEGQRIGAPIADPGAVIGIGQNYAAHAAESGSEPPERPIIFFKTPNTITGPYDAVGIPPQADKFDWEIELGIVISKQVAYLSTEEEAAEAIGGYFIANDLSERHFQLAESGGQWSKGKCMKDSTPIGPVLVTADALDPHDLKLTLKVNGEVRQRSSTSDMIFSVEQIVLHLSQYMQLEPGDIISTGTPEGVAMSGRFPYLEAGDVSVLEIEGLGMQRQEYYRVGAQVFAEA